MSKHTSTIERLIAEKCPNGIEYKQVWELTAWDKKFNGIDRKKQSRVIKYPYFPASNFKTIERLEGDVRLLSTGDYIGWTTEGLAGGNLCEGEIVAIPWGGRANIKYYNGKFVTADNRIATSLDTNILSNKFLYYWMSANRDLIEGFYRGSGIKHPSMQKVLEMKIPNPPIDIQHRIVNFLDKFTELEVELEVELEARKKQYEHYQAELLTFDDSIEYPIVELGEILEYEQPTRYVVKSTNYKNEYEIPVLTAGKSFLLGYTDDEDGIFPEDNLPVIIFDDFTTATKYVDFPFKVKSSAMKILKAKGDVDIRFVFYMMQTIEFNASQHKRYWISEYSKITIPLPPLGIQNEIANTLDKFDALVNDISIGLPAELKARRKQYEYYRDKLLTFNEYAG